MQTQMTPYFIVFGIRIKCRTESAHCFRGATFDHRSKRQMILTCQKRQLIPPTFDPRVGQDQMSVGSNVAKSRIECRYLGSYVVGIKCRWYRLSPHQKSRSMMGECKNTYSSFPIITTDPFLHADPNQRTRYI